MTQGKPKRHHYVPQGYLRGFTETPNTLFVANKDTRSIRLSSPKGTVYRPDYYTVDTLNEKDSSEVETNLSKIETTCLPLLRKLVESSDLLNSERADIAIYIALQYGRTPFSRARMNEVATILTSNAIKQKLADAINNPNEYDELVQFIAATDPSVRTPSKEELMEWALKPGPIAQLSIDNGTYVKQFFEHAWNTADGLLKTKWIIYHAPDETRFITSDNPVGLRVSRPLHEFEVLAIHSPGVKRYFPLNSTSCLVMIEKWENRTIQHRKISKKQVRNINKLLCAQAHKYVISGNEILLRSLISSP